MKKLILVLVFISAMYACKKEKSSDPDSDPYALPWKTEFISFQNIARLCGTHSSGYRLFYKDKIIRSECKEFGGYSISKSLRVNDSILLIFEQNEYFSGRVLQTFNGGISWTVTGYPCEAYSPMFHFVNPSLSYCITKGSRFDTNRSGNTYLITGIGASDLACYRDVFPNGTNYIFDLGTDSVGLDSTLITVNENLKFVIKFK